MNYAESLTAATAWLGQQPDTIFLGQSVAYPGNAMFKTLVGVPMEKRIEFPVAEDFQLGASIGISLTGKTVISIFPRMDFLLLAMNQLVNHLDKLSEFTNGQFKAKVIIRVGIGSTKPLNPGCQHCGDYTEAMKLMLDNIHIIKLRDPKYIECAYKDAYYWHRSSLIIEDMSLYGMV